MKIHAMIPSRDRAMMLQASIYALANLESGRHEVRYTVLCDDDDADTRAAAEAIKAAKVEVIQGPRRLINGWENEIVAASDADIFLPWPDDYLCITPAWDEIMAHGVGKAGAHAFSWKEIQDPENHTTIVLSKAWVRAAGRFFPEHFPFWFGDTWLKEVHGFLYGANMPIIDQLQLSHKRTPTTNMHDLGFWFSVFARTRSERIEESKRIATALGIEWESRPWLVTMYEQADEMQMAKLSEYEKIFGANMGVKSDAYRAAYARALARMQPRQIFEEAA